MDKKAQRDYFRLLKRAANTQLEAYRDTYKEIDAELAKIYANMDSVSLENSMKYQRLTKLQELINKRINELYRLQKSITWRGVKETTKLGYYSTAAEIQSVIVGIEFAGLDTNVIDAMSLNPLTGLTIPEYYDKNIATFKANVKQALMRNLIQGKSYKEAAKDIKSSLNIDYAKAKTISFTEMHRAQMQASDMAYNEATESGARLKKVWQHNPAASITPREDHAAMDGKEADEDGFFTLPDGTRTTAPGMTGEAKHDIFCHCSLLTLPAEMQPKYRLVKDAGKNEIIRYEDYEAWTRGEKVEKINFDF